MADPTFAAVILARPSASDVHHQNIILISPLPHPHRMPGGHEALTVRLVWIRTVS